MKSKYRYKKNENLLGGMLENKSWIVVVMKVVVLVLFILLLTYGIRTFFFPPKPSKPLIGKVIQKGKQEVQASALS